MKAVILAGAVAMLAASPARAASILDQVNDTPITSSVDMRSIDYQGQTFTVGIAGKLSSISMPLYGLEHPDVTVQFFLAPIVGGVAQFATPWEVDISSTTIPDYYTTYSPTRPVADWFNLDLSSLNISAQVGDQFAIMGHSPLADSPRIVWLASNPGPYAAGTPIGSWNLQNFPVQVRTDFDEDFATFMSPVPEPATWALFILGFGVMGLSLRAKRNRGMTARLTPGPSAC